MAERLEHKVNKSEKELDSTVDHMKAYEAKLIEMKDQHEQDLNDLRMSEGQIKKQLQSEIFECKKKEEEARVQMQKEIQESKKREAYIKEQWAKEIEEATDKENSYIKKIVELEKELKERDEQIEKLKNQKIVAEKGDPNGTPRLKIKANQIKYASE